ncbi:prepilin-type N-terminal cleavage/methylation domain-containing protein [uncultured Microbacterium sp.]|uniref:prepilin-type N-terminal cleavage/methylation domain-containing protein n=1 Tax=uncultured Microbacterium sp. TaxID=191216 RepID=UPI00260CC034|nr:prepilin-type N-terminal cleavage/methylation domain-containing protein [uncultured Microbacterium sp.]
MARRASRTGSDQYGFTIVELLIVVVVIAILAAITIVSYNGITKQAKASAMASTLSQWKKKSELQKVEKSITCPENYSFVYGNSVLGTSDFRVMKYEAKNVGGVATSQAAGTPWVSISQTDAITASTASGGHLITEAEWMTIAADVLSVKYNWSGGEVGAGYLYQGHVNDNPASALAASVDDFDPLNGITGGTGTTVGTNSSRVLWLSSGDAIWDLSGNVWEWTQQAVGTPAMTMSQVGVPGDSTFNWREWTLGSLSLGNLPAISRPSALTSYTNPITGVTLSGATGWDTAEGIGGIYANYADTGSRAFLRGSSLTSRSWAGVLMLKLNYAPSSPDATIGFRVAR